VITDFLAPFPWWQKVMTREPLMSADTDSRCLGQMCMECHDMSSESHSRTQ
jgi:hypothetical protein